MTAAEVGERIRMAKRAILQLFNEGTVEVAYDRELRYRLEGDFSHDDVAAAIKDLAGSGNLKPTNVPGRRGPSLENPNKFYRLPSSHYDKLLPIMKKKLDLSTFIAGVSRDMGRHAELLWWRAFKRNDWNLHPAAETGPFAINEYKGRTASIRNDIDFIAEKDEVTYGVEIKNSLGYPEDLFWKFTVAAELDTIPLIVARWLNPAQVPLIKELGGESIVYRDALYSSTYYTLIEEARQLLGVHIIALDEIDDDYFSRKVESLHDSIRAQVEGKKKKLDEYLLKRRYQIDIRRVLGTRKG